MDPSSDTSAGTAAQAATSTVSAFRRSPRPVLMPVTRPPTTSTEGLSRLGNEPSAASGELVQQHLDQRGKVDPSFPGIEDRSLPRDGAGVDAWRHPRHLGRGQKPGVVADAAVVSVDRGNLVRCVVGVPGEAAVEAQPGSVKVPGGQCLIAIDADYPKFSRS
jgi:hypothetical protein